MVPLIVGNPPYLLQIKTLEVVPVQIHSLEKMISLTLNGRAHIMRRLEFAVEQLTEYGGGVCHRLRHLQHVMKTVKYGDNGKEHGNYRDYIGIMGYIGYILGLYEDNGRYRRRTQTLGHTRNPAIRTPRSANLSQQLHKLGNCSFFCAQMCESLVSPLSSYNPNIYPI